MRPYLARQRAGGVIDRSKARGIPYASVAEKAVMLFGTRAAETILASGHMSPHQQAEHMNASDRSIFLLNTLARGGRPHMTHHALERLKRRTGLTKVR
jgi:hypothetical protein